MYYCYLYCVQEYFWKRIFLTCKKKCKTCLETCLEPVKNEFCIPPTMIMFPCRVCVSPLCVKPVVYMKQGPRSGIFSVYIWRNADYILLTYSCPRFCVKLFFFFLLKKLSKKKSWFALFFFLISFHSKLS